jgi:hypothetical protein
MSAVVIGALVMWLSPAVFVAWFIIREILSARPGPEMPARVPRIPTQYRRIGVEK